MRNVNARSGRIGSFACCGLVCFGLLAIMTIAGCGGGSDTYDISGTITYGGKPVPVGRIVFEPDRSAGNKGHANATLFRKGKYETVAGRGPGNGPHIVTIYGHESLSDEGEIVFGNPLFPRYQVKVDLPAKASIQDFDVPASHGAGG